MLPKRYDSYDEAYENFSWDETWDIVEGDKESLNIGVECLDRHDGVCAHVLNTKEDTLSEYQFAEITEAANQFANLLDKKGVEKGERVVVNLDMSFEFLVSFFGTIKQGAVAVPCPEVFGPDAMAYRVQDSEPTIAIAPEDVDSDQFDETVEVITTQELSTQLEGLSQTYTSQTDAEDTAVVNYTSGTTGTPTPHAYRQKSLIYYAGMKDLMLDFSSEDKAFTTSSTGWGAGLWGGLLAPLVFGIPAGFLSGPFDAKKALEFIDDNDVNLLISVVPTALRKMVDAAEEMDQPPQIEKANYTGEPMPAELSRKVEELFGALPRSSYGASEMTGKVVLADQAFPDFESRHGSLGKPLPGNDVLIVDDDGNELPNGEVGRIAVRESDGLKLSEDAGLTDEDGYFWSKGRADDVILSSGYTIGPKEVEESLEKHPKVAVSGVIGVPDEELGNRVKAYIETDEAGTEELKDELKNFVREELGKHEYPREIEFIDKVPQTNNQKTQRIKLRELHESES
ncbi:AMP-binding protein [Natronomonas salsuginis]|uniref:AMP-dependent synthetase n=1 Tax=Natronomonas salsuginis TaxID=2217661 RepID=A0A4U5J990_9EURY|nr:AMP-binding protein [Natronomonas salsuginis]TKR25055.1 hypothetical protein DM868_11855 [Natronomonas salsuginis]